MMDIQRNNPALAVYTSEREAFENQSAVEMLFDDKTTLCNGQFIQHQRAYPWSPELQKPVADELLGLDQTKYDLSWEAEEWTDRRSKTKRCVYHITSVWKALPVFVNVRMVCFMPWGGHNRRGKANTGLKFTVVVEHGGTTYCWEEMFCPWAVFLATVGLTVPYREHRDCNDCWNHYYISIEKGYLVLKGQISWSLLTRVDRHRQFRPEARLQLTKLEVLSGKISMLRDCPKDDDTDAPCPGRNFERFPQIIANYRARWGADLAANQWFGEYRLRQAADRQTDRFCDEEDEVMYSDEDDSDFPCAAGGCFQRRHDFRDNGGYNGIFKSQQK